MVKLFSKVILFLIRLLKNLQFIGLHFQVLPWTSPIIVHPTIVTNSKWKVTAANGSSLFLNSHFRLSHLSKWKTWFGFRFSWIEWFCSLLFLASAKCVWQIEITSTSIFSLLSDFCRKWNGLASKKRKKIQTTFA